MAPTRVAFKFKLCITEFLFVHLIVFLLSLFFDSIARKESLMQELGVV